jgi:hypothetical protein
MRELLWSELISTSLAQQRITPTLQTRELLWSELISTSLGSIENNSYLADEGVVVVRTHLYITWLHAEKNSYLKMRELLWLRLLSTSHGSTENTSYFAGEGVVVVRTHLYFIGSPENTSCVLSR